MLVGNSDVPLSVRRPLALMVGKSGVTKSLSLLLNRVYVRTICGSLGSIECLQRQDFDIPRKQKEIKYGMVSKNEMRVHRAYVPCDMASPNDFTCEPNSLNSELQSLNLNPGTPRPNAFWVLGPKKKSRREKCLGSVRV